MQNKQIARLRNIAIGLVGAGGEISISRSDAALLGFEADSESIAVPVPDFIERVNGLETDKPVANAKKSKSKPPKNEPNNGAGSEDDTDETSKTDKPTSKAKKTEPKPKQPDPDNEEGAGGTVEGDSGKASEDKSPNDETPPKRTAPKRSTAKKTDAK